MFAWKILSIQCEHLEAIRGENGQETARMKVS